MNPRTCIVTRQELTPDEMIRFACGPDDHVYPDLKRKLPGRGVWVSLSRSSVETAVKKNLFARGFKKPVTAGQDLAELVSSLLRRQCLDYLGLAKKAGQMTIGLSKVETRLRDGKASVVVHSNEAASDGRSKVAQAIRMAGLDNIRICDQFGGSELDAVTGLGNVTHLSIEEGSLARQFVFAADRLEKYNRD